MTTPLFKKGIRIGNTPKSAVGVPSAVTIKQMSSGTIALDPASITNAVKGNVTFTLTGARTGDFIMMIPPSALEVGLSYVGAEVTSNDTVTVYILNATAAPIDGASRTWRWFWMDLT